MDVADYRKQYAAQLEQAASHRTTFREQLARSKSAVARRQDTATADDTAAAVVVLRDKTESVELRTRALGAVSTPLGTRLGTRQGLMEVVLEVLRDEAEPVPLRKAALTALQQASFRVQLFASVRPAYLAALRSLIDDRDAELRRRAIGILAREKDEYVQRRLLEGLRQPSKALVPVAKAIQFLGYDIHAEHFPLLRQIVQHPPSRAAKREAVRLLGADPSAKDLLTDVLNDKSEAQDIRRESAIALQALDPDRFEEQARRIALDEGEDDQLRASCISALSHFASPATLTDDRALSRGMEHLRETSPSRQVKQATATYIAKHGS